jgi:methylenetetrahydrofolate dehydrogenase (NADP+)/methenyltetrahydrofolate cyclohydrolase
MITKIIDGRALAAEIKTAVAEEVFLALKKNQDRPSLGIVLVGERSDSELYVKIKEREARQVGLITHTYRLPAETTATEIKEVLEFLNQDESVNGILVQLPLPEHLPTDEIMAVIDPNKDADGFLENHPEEVMSPVAAAVSLMLERQDLNRAETVLGILHNSEIFGETLKKVLEKTGFNQIILATKEEIEKIKDCDVVISALGLPYFINSKKLKFGAVVIDVGTTRKGKKVEGDLDPRGADKYLSAYSPVPGGVGPLTVAFLFKNVLALYTRQQKS